MNPPLLRKKLAGVLIPVFAMRRADDMGIGDTKAVMNAIDFCAAHHFAVLQTLPIHDTVGDHSPYNPISSRALSPTLLTLDAESVPGLTKEMIERLAPPAYLVQLRDGVVKHRSVHSLKLQILMEAYHGFMSRADEHGELWAEFERFQEQEASWLPGYTLYRIAVAEHDGNAHWEEWRPEMRTYAAAETWLANHLERERLQKLREGHAYIQWIARRQWLAVRAHADARSILLMGEMSFGVSKSSADVWSNPQLFDVEWSMGTRPVSYFDTNKDSERWGQNWGLPPYRWENHRSEAFAWLRDRVKTEALFFHICRLDHLRGYFRAYMFPWQGGSHHAEFATLTEEEARAKTGGLMPRFVPGPDDDETTSQMNDLQGREIIKVIQEATGSMGLFAEIMGAMPAFMRKAIEDLQVPNLTFPLLETDADGRLMPVDSFRELSLISYSNHDHAPLAALYRQMHEKIKAGDHGAAMQNMRNLLDFAGWTEAPPDTLTSDLLAALQKALFATHCRLAVLMSSDLLGTAQRFNLPGSYGSETWCERLELPFAELERHPLYGARIAAAEKAILDSGRDRVPDALTTSP